MTAAIQTPFDRAIEAISHPRRRSVLMVLADTNSLTMDDLNDDTRSGSDDEDDEMPSLVHNHLPKLHELGFIDWDRDTGEIRRGEHWDQIEPVLVLMEEHRDELPDGYI